MLIHSMVQVLVFVLKFTRKVDCCSSSARRVSLSLYRLYISVTILKPLKVGVLPAPPSKLDVVSSDSECSIRREKRKRTSFPWKASSIDLHGQYFLTVHGKCCMWVFDAQWGFEMVSLNKTTRRRTPQINSKSYKELYVKFLGGGIGLDRFARTRGCRIFQKNKACLLLNIQPHCEWATHRPQRRGCSDWIIVSIRRSQEKVGYKQCR